MGKKAAVGGFPGRVAYGARAIAPDGAKALVSELRAQCPLDQKDVPDHELLAKYARDAMQAEYDKLKQSRPFSVVSLLLSASPAVVFYMALGMSIRRFLARKTVW